MIRFKIQNKFKDFVPCVLIFCYFFTASLKSLKGFSIELLAENNLRGCAVFDLSQADWTRFDSHTVSKSILHLPCLHDLFKGIYKYVMI